MKRCYGNSEKSGQGEEGYILLVLLLFIALLSIGFLGMVQRIQFEVKRDREEEMIHRGVQYSRAVRNFVNRVGRYPASIEELENTNRMRFLRKRYKDPITGKDFKILHMNDMPSFIRTTGVGTPVASLAQHQDTSGKSGDAPTTDGASTEAVGAESSDPNRQSPDAQGDASQSDTSTAAPAPRPPAPNAGTQPGGGLIIGVASTSKQKTMREFNKKNHYNQWLFIYDPTTVTAGIIKTPSQPPLRIGLQGNQQQSGATATQAPGTDPGTTTTPTGPASSQQ
jgi:type II secretory pathway pseudopilin PulG